MSENYRHDKFKIGEMAEFVLPINWEMAYQMEEFEEIFGLGPYLISGIKEVPESNREMVGHSQFLLSDRWTGNTKFSGAWFIPIVRMNEVILRVE